MSENDIDIDMAAKENYKEMQDLINLYDSFEELSLQTDQFVKYGQELNGTISTLDVIYDYIKREASNENVLFLKRIVASTEADEASNMAAQASINNAKQQMGTSNTGTGKTTSSVSTRVLNSGTIMDKMKEFMRRVGNWIVVYYGKSLNMAQKFIAMLQQKLAALKNSKSSLNFKVKGVCYDTTSLNLSQAIARINGVTGTNYREALNTIVSSISQNLDNLVDKEEKSLNQNEVDNLVRAYIDANNRITSQRNDALNAFKAEQEAIKKEQDKEKMKLHQQKLTAMVNVANIYVRFIFRNTMKVLAVTSKNIAVNG